MRRGAHRMLLAQLLILLLALLTAGGHGRAMAGVGAEQPAPAVDPDAQAVDLAQQVLAGGEGAFTALQSALAQSGIAVVGDDGSVLVAPAQPGQGLAFHEWELRSMLAAQAGGFASSLAAVSDALSAADPALDGAPLAAFLQDGVHQAAQGNRADLRFWARFLTALAGASNPDNDIQTGSPDRVTIGAIALALLAQRLAGDLYQFAQPPATFALHYAQASSSPCAMNSVESTIFDATALGYGVGFGKVLDYLAEHGLEAAGSVARTTSVANLVLAYAKLAWAIGAFKADISIDNSPLVRTKQARPATGELRLLTAKVHMDTGNAQLVNCLRPLLNSMGLDFSLPGDGAIGGAVLQWQGRQGFVQGTDLSGRLVEFNGDTQNQVTNDKGVGTVGVEGFGQDHDLPDDSLPVMKQASVAVNATVQPASLFQDLLSAVGIASGGPVGLLGIPAEMITRSSWAFAATYAFPVQDWQEAQYEVDFDSTLRWDTGNHVWIAHIKSTVLLQRTPTGELEGKAPARMVDYSAVNSDGSGCAFDAHSPRDGTFTVKHGTVRPATTLGGPPEVILIIDPGIETFQYDENCPVHPYLNLLAPPEINAFFPILHASERVSSAPSENLGYVISNWSPGSGDIVARKTYMQSCCTFLKETTTIELRRVVVQQ